MTKPALVTRMDESEGHFVYVKLNELDGLACEKYEDLT